MNVSSVLFENKKDSKRKKTKNEFKGQDEERTERRQEDTYT
jgi:hypothetical protein